MVRSKVSKPHTHTLLIKQHSSPLGPLWSHWTSRGLQQLNWKKPTLGHTQHGTQVPNKLANKLDALLQNYFEGNKVQWHDIPLDHTTWTPFTRRVYGNCLNIPFGSTVTYKALAKLAGNEQASRAVGAAMSRNQVLLVVPCHRVVSTSGKLQGYSAEGGINTKHLLLELERHGQLPQRLSGK